MRVSYLSQPLGSFRHPSLRIELFNDHLSDDHITLTSLGILTNNKGSSFIRTKTMPVLFDITHYEKIIKNVQVLPDGTAFATYEGVTYKVEVVR